MFFQGTAGTIYAQDVLKLIHDFNFVAEVFPSWIFCIQDYHEISRSLVCSKCGYSYLTKIHIALFLLTFMLEQSEQNNKRQITFYVHFYLLLAGPIPPLQNFHIFLIVVLSDQCNRRLKLYQCSSRSWIPVCPSYTSQATSHQLS